MQPASNPRECQDTENQGKEYGDHQHLHDFLLSQSGLKSSGNGWFDERQNFLTRGSGIDGAVQEAVFKPFKWIPNWQKICRCTVMTVNK